MRELVTMFRERPDPPGAPAGPFTSPRDAAMFLIPLLEAETVEVLVVLLLDTKSRLRAVEWIGRGTIDAAVCTPMTVFSSAMATRASSVIVAHNHPSGDPTPSADDGALVRRLVAAGEVLGVPLSDAIIVGNRRYYSFREAGALNS